MINPDCYLAAALVLSGAYLDSVYGQVEWLAAQPADPHGFARKLLPVRIEDCSRPGLLGAVVSIDLFDRAVDDAHVTCSTRSVAAA